MRCSDCNGEGRLADALNDEGEVIYVPCPHCDGQGWIEPYHAVYDFETAKWVLYHAGKLVRQRKRPLYFNTRASAVRWAHKAGLRPVV